jgi:hypothetical protein
MMNLPLGINDRETPFSGNDFLDDLRTWVIQSFPIGQSHDCITDYGMNTETAKNLAVAGKKRSNLWTTCV